MVIHDLSGKATAFTMHVPRVAYLLKKGKLKSGQVLVEPQKAEVLVGEETEDGAGEVYSVVLDSKDRKEAVALALSALRKISELNKSSFQVIAPEGGLGVAIRKILEYV